MINNGIISIGNDNINTLNNEIIKNELKILLEKINKNSEDYIILKEAYKTNDKSKIKELLKCLSKETINLIKELNLGILENIIVNLFMK